MFEDFRRGTPEDDLFHLPEILEKHDFSLDPGSASVEDFHRRTGGRIMNLLTSDEYPAYAGAILEVYGQVVQPERQGHCGRFPHP